MIFKDLKKVTHHRTPQSRKRLAADCDYFAFIPLAVAEDNPKQDVKGFPRSGTTLLHYYLSCAFF
jgi:hypothetical protein